MNEIRELRKKTGLSQKKFCDKYGIPIRTLQDWEYGKNEPAPYLVNLLERAVNADSTFTICGKFNTGDPYYEDFHNEKELNYVAAKILVNERCCAPNMIKGSVPKEFLPKYLEKWIDNHVKIKYKRV